MTLVYMQRKRDACKCMQENVGFVLVSCSLSLCAELPFCFFLFGFGFFGN